MKKVIWLIIVSIILGACGPITPIPTVTPTLTATELPTATYTPSPTLTPSPTAVPSSTPVSSLPVFRTSNGPEKSESYYKLRPWYEFDYGYILNNIANDSEFDLSYYKISDYLATFQKERLLMFPNSPEYNDVLWKIQSSKPNVKVVPGMKPGEDLLSLLISNLLSDGVQVADLEVEMQKHGYYLVDLLTIPNLIGNGEDGFAMSITVSDSYIRMARTYMVLPANSTNRVEALGSWEETDGPGWGHYYEMTDAGDTNDNSLPEVVITERTGASGLPQHWSETISHIEWSKSANRFVVSEHPVFSQSCDDGPCEGDWRFFKVDSQSVLTTQSYWTTRGGCPDLVLQQNSIWDAEQYKYVVGDSKVIPPEKNSSQLCQLAWAEVALSIQNLTRDNSVSPGWKNDFAVSIVEESILNWPLSADSVWGAAGQDSFKLRLGIWHELRGEEEQADHLLDELTNNPHLPKFDFMARLAKLYLRSKANQGKLKACSSLENYYQIEYRKIYTASSVYNIDELLLKNWGVVDWVGHLCDVNEMLPAVIENPQIFSGNELGDWLKKSETRIYQEIKQDLNADGLEDYLFLMDASGSTDPGVWAFFASPDGYRAKYIYDFYFSDADQRRIKVLPIQIGNGEPIYLITASDQLIVVQLAPNDSSPEILIEEFLGVKNFQLIDNEMPAEIMVNVDSNWEGRKTKTYQWDSPSKDFILQDDVFVVGQTTIENMIYNDHAYSEAVNYIDQFLTVVPPEPRSVSYCSAGLPGNGCVYQPDWYVPYFRYLQGLANEKLGRKQQAAEIYFNLWKNYPNNVFGVAASLKLEPVQP